MRLRFIIVCIVFGLFAVLSVGACSHPVRPAEFVINRLDVSPAVADPSVNIKVAAEIGNTGGLAENYTAVLKIDGKERDKQTVLIRPSENKTIVFTISEHNIGQHEVALDAAKTSFTVKAPVLSGEGQEGRTKKSGNAIKGMHATLRYDYLSMDENMNSQIAVWHSYAQFVKGSWSLVEGRDIKAPIIILPRKEGFVTIVRSTTEGYQFMPLGWTAYSKSYDEKAMLNQPGWGLATTFHPESTPYRIQKIRMACVANYTEGLIEEYDNKFIKVQILNDKAKVIWSEFFPWSRFRGTAYSDAEGLPAAQWFEIPVNDITVDGDFTVEVCSLGKQYIKEVRGYDYFALAYEKVGLCSNNKTNSFISENGKRPDPWITLYNQYGDRVCFNLCIRVDGNY